MRRNASRFSSSRSIGWAVLFSAALHAGAFVSFSTGAPVEVHASQIEVQVVEAAAPPADPKVPEKSVAALPPTAAHPSRPQPDRRARAAARAKAASDSRRIAEIVREGEAVCRGANGTWISLLLRLDRLRGQAISEDAEALAQRLPALGEIAAARESSVLETFDQVRISTAGTPGHGTVLLVAHHRLSEEAMRTAVIAAAQANGYRTIEGSSESDRVFEWRKNDAAGAAPRLGRSVADAASPRGEERVVLLPEPGLIVVAERGPLGPIGTSSPNAEGPSLRERLAALTDAGDPLEEILPPDAAGIVSITSVPQGGAAPKTDLVLGGRPNPHTLIAVLQVDPAPSLDVVAEFSEEINAEFWGSHWRALSEADRGDLFGRPLHLLPLVRGARLVRRESALYVHEAVTRADLEGTPLLGARRSGPTAP